MQEFNRLVGFYYIMRVDVVVYILLVFMIRVGESQITCYDCEYDDVELCGNKTITCRHPADTCYTMTSENGGKMKKSCSWSGHCLRNFICEFREECKLRCCEKELCNIRNSGIVVVVTPSLWVMIIGIASYTISFLFLASMF